MLSVGSLFSGIGGLELGLEWAGFGPLLWQVELDPGCRRVLAAHWPSADRSVEDVRGAGARNLAPPGLICGGFPCQDVSVAGQRRGLAGGRSSLWWEFARVVGELVPRAVVVENVFSGKGAWLCGVRGRLHLLGYRTRALEIAASDLGAPHGRRRVFVVGVREATDSQGSRSLADSGGARSQVGHDPLSPERGNPAGLADLPSRRSSESGMARGADGVPDRVDGCSFRWPSPPDQPAAAWEPSRTIVAPDGFTPRLRALGNAVVPQCAYVAGLVLCDMLEGTC